MAVHWYSGDQFENLEAVHNIAPDKFILGTCVYIRCLFDVDFDDWITHYLCAYADGSIGGVYMSTVVRLVKR
jgi:hypothetical protein